MKFMALGGTDYIGASSYYLELDNTHILLDCGSGISGQKCFFPDFKSLVTNENSHLLTLSQIDGVIISHAHCDHMGGLWNFVEKSSETPIYATTLTQTLGEHLFYDKEMMHSKETGFTLLKKDMDISKVLEKIRPASYRKTFKIKNVKVTFYEAGHILGACMVYLESDEGNVLYTGDFMSTATYLTNGYCLPEKLQINTIIMCGLRAKNPSYQMTNTLDFSISKIKRGLLSHGQVYCDVNQLTKGVEVLQRIIQEFPLENIYLDKDIFALCEKLENSGFRVLGKNCRCFGDEIYTGQKDGIYIGAKRYNKNFNAVIRTDLTLHSTFTDCVELVKKYSPENLLIVHAPNSNEFQQTSIEENLPTNILIKYPVEAHMYSNN